MNYWFSPENNAFYPVALKDAYIAAASLPQDLTAVSDAVFMHFSDIPPEGKKRGADEKGHPAWIDIPPPSRAEIVAAAEAQKQSLISQATDYISTRQWQGKSAIGRITEDELAQYNRWLDYIDALQVVDARNAPDISWPALPAA
ncbi:tail fiber assembly protein [Mixta calida]|uniref:tail fiber assembly protein n=1 Tax=Mixta calida TaxID=665913 RepID=UPI00290B0521|nr:tail fiber assembly protein [Mixta calida]MDU6416496.1 tail fiber assembly protein [Mixta calida]